MPYVTEPGTGRVVYVAPLLTQQEFMDRWEASPAAAALDLLFSLEAKDSAAGTQARKWLTRFRTARGIDPADPRTEATTDNLLALAVANSVITTGQAAAARPIILAPVPPDYIVNTE